MFLVKLVLFIDSLWPAGNRVTPEGVALVMFPKTEITLLLGRRDEKVSNSSAVRRRAAGEVGAISTSKSPFKVCVLL
jgi:hypothetical protein